jgi:hypothetical protein
MLQNALKFIIIIKSRKQRMVYMRQGGMVPKNHNSGVYWVRADAKTGNQKVEDTGVSLVFWFILWCLIVLCGSWFS